MFILNEKRINIYAPYTSADGVTYANLTDPEIRAQLGVVELAEPAQPEDYSDALYYRTEQDEAPYVIYTKKSDEQIAEQELAEAQAKARDYLNSTDWYVTRLAETGKAIPEEVLVGRAEVRLVL